MNSSLQVQFKKLDPNAVIPSYANSGDAGLDLTAISISEPDDYPDIVSYGTGLAVAIPEGYVGLIYPRSSLYKKMLTLANHVGVIDSGYRGEIKLNFRYTYEAYTRKINIDYETDTVKFNMLGKSNRYQVGDRIGQLIIQPIPNIIISEVDHLSNTDRGSKGFGSSGS